MTKPRRTDKRTLERQGDPGQARKDTLLYAYTRGAVHLHKHAPQI